MKKIAIYCGASTGKDSIYEEHTKKIGQWMLANHYDLVYGGGAVGLMGIIADTIIEGKGKTIGVMPTFLADRELSHNGLDELIIVEDMHERKKKMIDLSDAYIALPGGPGTLEEISEVISWGRIGEHQNPCIFYNVNGYYNLLAAFFDTMIENQFLTQTDRDKILFSDSLDEIKHFIENYEPPVIRQYRK
ncbi:LOG family protein [Vagococcus hydrophili]|uniref:Cytokinin riboside 5'-monophosphate phosphoribohydrolase n=1 Tax=Vagococcus hydrophili TaxID=2714947 RepID=A0A6G8ATI9_9ENTE|nr:TIGR00730 family Rossman fold protein [Vagococcus hydrophili]QIL48401.1 TIGR00730 family Rossman fold protein [Vagococcus hydrophili]